MATKKKTEVNETGVNLTEAAETVNNDAPLQVDYMTTLTSCNFDGQNFNYYYEVNEDYTSDIREFEEEMRENLQNLWDTDPVFDEIKDNLRKVNGSVIYNYVGDESGEKMTIHVKI